MNQNIYNRIFQTGQIDEVSGFWWVHGTKICYDDIVADKNHIIKNLKSNYNKKHFAFSVVMFDFLKENVFRKAANDYYAFTKKESDTYFHTSLSHPVVIAIKYAGR